MTRIASVLLCVWILSGAGSAETVPGLQTVEAGCISGGYTSYTDAETGVVTILEQMPMLGHDFGDWSDCGDRQKRVCSRCGEEEEIMYTELPAIRLYGSMGGISKEHVVCLRVEYEDGERSFSCYAFLSLQGHATLNLEKKNYMLRLYDDEAHEDKHQLYLNGWHREHKFVLKADLDDPTLCRNLIAARVWSDMVSSRENVDPRLMSTSNHGAVDGFPVTLWLNDTFLGLYTMNLHKDNDLYDMDDDESSAVVIANTNRFKESMFRAETEFLEDTYDWELEFCGTEDTAWCLESFNRLIRFVMDSSDAEFKSGLGSYLDVDGAIDYLIFISALGLRDNSAKNLVMITYDGIKWIPSVYSMKDAFSKPCIPIRTQQGWTTNTNSLLWDRLMNCYEAEIKERYHALRRSLLSEGALIDRVETYMNAIPQRDYDMDAQLYPDRSRDGRKQIISFIRENLAKLDEAWGGQET